MSTLKQWLHGSSPVVKVLMAISLTTGLFIVHKLYYKPYSTRQRHLKAEEWANMIIEREESMRDSAENQ